jgi:hypothetical protein
MKIDDNGLVKSPYHSDEGEYTMKNVLAFCVLFFMLLSCSADDTEDGDKGTIEKATDKVAHAVVEKIQTPIDKAKAIKATEEQRTDQYKKQIE